MSLYDKIRDAQTAVLGLGIFLGLVGSAWILSSGLIAMKRYSDEAISVTGAASQQIRSNLATWRGTVSRQADTLPAAYAALKQDEAQVLAYLKQAGFAPAAITPQPVTTETLYGHAANGYNTNTIEGYRLREAIQVESPDVDRVDQVSQGATALVNQGIALESEPPQYFYTKLDSLKVNLLGQATENARQRAQAMAKNTGNTIGVMRSSRMGVFQITPVNSTDVSDEGISDTSAKDKKVTAVVSVSFAVR